MDYYLQVLNLVWNRFYNIPLKYVNPFIEVALGDLLLTFMFLGVFIPIVFKFGKSSVNGKSNLSDKSVKSKGGSSDE